MSETKWTPGPWRTFDGNPSKIEIICGGRSSHDRWPSAGIRMAEIRFKRLGRGGAFSGNAVDAANAHLIAAAPELYDALAAIVDALDDGDRTATAARQIANIAGHNALAKARGETP